MEGGSDARFFDSVLKPLLVRKYDRVVIRTYASMKRDKFSALLYAIRAMGADYLVIADYDCSPCVTSKKEWLNQHIKGLDQGRTRIVIEEIESWYAAGLDEQGIAKFGMPVLAAMAGTDRMTKEQFNDMVPAKYDSRIDFMMEVLKVYSLETARRKNRSFEYFLRKQGLVADMVEPRTASAV
ncbi:MAG: hypothetical protein ABFD62_18110 [Syntrophaceae bacterium]